MPVHALTHRGTDIEKSIITPVKVKTINTGKELATLGIWDTGATGSVVTKSTAQALGLIPITKTIVNGVHGPKPVNVYYVNITLNNNQITLNTLVTECEVLSADKTVGMLIGMNIITLGDFSISNYEGKTVMTFRQPSLEKFDFVEDVAAYNKYLKIHMAWVSKGNNLCPCNSGKSWNNCHGKKYNV